VEIFSFSAKSVSPPTIGLIPGLHAWKGPLKSTCYEERTPAHQGAVSFLRTGQRNAGNVRIATTCKSCADTGQAPGLSLIQRVCGPLSRNSRESTAIPGLEEYLPRGESLFDLFHQTRNLMKGALRKQARKEKKKKAKLYSALAYLLFPPWLTLPCINRTANGRGGWISPPDCAYP